MASKTTVEVEDQEAEARSSYQTLNTCEESSAGLAYLTNPKPKPRRMPDYLRYLIGLFIALFIVRVLFMITLLFIATGLAREGDEYHKDMAKELTAKVWM